MLASTAAIALVASAVAPVASAASFKDLNGHMYENEILALVDAGIINGYPDGTFLPNNSLTRSDVVKLLGKYLVSLGYEVPSDYKTKMRFTDLTAQSQDELLQYAALVKDVGVFQGSAGQLMHRDEMRRDQMATVLVRAFNVINDFDYVAHVKEQGFTSTISDLNRTTVEHQTNIAVLDYYDMVKGASFNPKDMTKRGQFAYFLYHMLNVETKPVLTVKKIEVQAADKLSVTLSDDKAYTVTLSKPLVENVETDVTFTIGEVEYSAKVKYEVPDLKVSSVTNPNSGQIKIDFNQPVTLTDTLKEEEINKLVQVAGVNNPGKVDLLKGELSADKKSLIVTIKGTKPLVEGRYNVVVKDIRTDKGLTLVKYDDVPVFTADRTAPAIASVENVGATRVKVKFTEPVNNTSGATQFKLTNGVPVLGVTGTIEKNSTEVIYDLTNARANGAILTPGTSVTATFGTLVDLANNVAPLNLLTTTFSIGNKDGVPPVLLNLEQLGAKKFKLTFSEEIRDLATNELIVSTSNAIFSVASIVKDEQNPAVYVVTTNQPLEGYTSVSTAQGRYITDLSGETNTFSTAANFVQDRTKPNYISSAVVNDKGEEYLELTFDRNIEVTASSRLQINGNYVFQGNTQQINNQTLVTPIKHPTNDRILRVKLNEALRTIDYLGATYFININLVGITSEYGEVLNNIPYVQFVRGGDTGYNQNAIAVLGVETSSYPNSTVGSNEILVTFSHPIDGLTALNRENYILEGGGTIASVVPTNNNRQVQLILAAENRVQAVTAHITIQNIKAQGSTVTMAPYSNSIFLSENIRPTVDRSVNVINAATSATLTFTVSETLKTPIVPAAFTVNVNRKNVNGTYIPLTITGQTVYNDQTRQVSVILSQPLLQDDQVTVTLATKITDLVNNELYFTPATFTYFANQTQYLW